MGCEMGKIKVVMKKPVYLGQTILDLSKLVMYEFQYDYMKPKYGDKQRLCHIKTEDFYKDIAEDIPARFDTSGYDSSTAGQGGARPLPVGMNKKVIGSMKDKMAGEIITEFVALRPKLYSYKKLDGCEDRKCKGIKKGVVKRTLTSEDYKNCLLKQFHLYRSQLMFRLIKHDVHMIEVNKLALSTDDDKRIVGEDGISIKAGGHYSSKYLSYG